MSGSPDERVVVVMPAFNAAGFIVEALDSIGLDEGIPVRVVVVDDGSTDETAEVVTRWMQQSPLPVTLIRQQNLGISVARNAAILATDAPYIALLDADDQFLPGHLRRLVDAMKASPDAVLAFDDAEQFAGDDVAALTMLERAEAVTAGIERLPREGGAELLRAGLFESLLLGNWIAPSTWLIRRSAMALHGLFDPRQRMVEDREFALRWAQGAGFLAVKGLGVRKRVHGANLTRPENAESFSRYALLGLSTIRHLSGPEYRAPIDSAISTTAQELWYQASLRGSKQLAACATWARQLNLGVRPSPRDVARAAMRFQP